MLLQLLLVGRTIDPAAFCLNYIAAAPPASTNIEELQQQILLLQHRVKKYYNASALH
jgi:hypothetical protein